MKPEIQNPKSGIRKQPNLRPLEGLVMDVGFGIRKRLGASLLFPGLILVSALSSAAPLPPSHFTVGPTEITGYADLDGDGNADCVIVDRETGAIRVGYHVSTGNFNWAAARAGGIYDVSGVTGGRILNAARDTIALTGPVANRVNLLELPLPTTVANPVMVTYGGVRASVAGCGSDFRHDGARGPIAWLDAKWLAQ